MEPAAGRKSLHDFPASWLRPDLWLEEKARNLPDKPALLFRDRPITYGEFWQRVSRLAAGLLRTGLQPGDRIACMTTNHPAFLETYFASSLVGSIFVPLNFRLAAAEILFQMEDADPSVLILGTADKNDSSALLRDLRTRAIRVFQIEADKETEALHYETLFMDSTAARFSDLGVRYLEEWEQMQEVWRMLTRVAPSQTALQRLRSDLASLERDWKAPPGGKAAPGDLFKDTVRSLLVHHLDAQGSALETLTEAAMNDLLPWALDWHMSALKESLS